MPLDRMITLPDAIQKYGLTENRLRALAEKGKIRAGLLSSGEIVVSEQDAQAQKPVSKKELPAYKRHADMLNGHVIGLGEAARKYAVPVTTLSGWVSKGYIEKIGQNGQKILLNEVDVAYCAEIYQQHSGQGKWLFNEDGTPYQKGTSTRENMEQNKTR